MIKQASIFSSLSGIEYFRFEEDFVAENVRCIPMIVRFKMDMAGIKLKLADWSRFSVEERKKLALDACTSGTEKAAYRRYLAGLIEKYTGMGPVEMMIVQDPAWAQRERVPAPVQEKAGQFGWSVSTDQWGFLSDLQRFALLKLCRPGHENKNFPKAMQEFGLSGACRNS